MKYLLLICGIYFTLTTSHVMAQTDSLRIPAANWSFVTAGFVNNLANVRWSILKGGNIVWFEVEHSTDGQTFRCIGILAAAGNSDEGAAYSWLHSPAPGMNYYRIRELGKDGSASYSKIVSLPCEKGLTRTVAVPNPATTDLTLVFVEPAGNSKLDIYNAENQLLTSMKIPDGASQQVLDLTSFAKGVYYLYFQNRDKMEIIRIVKISPPTSVFQKSGNFPAGPAHQRG
jgi:hypothetical protein